MLVGCKVTLRKDQLNDFFDSLLLASPRMERLSIINMSNKLKPYETFKSKKLKQKNSNFFLLNLSELLFFYPIELGLGINNEVRKIEITFIFNT